MSTALELIRAVEENGGQIAVDGEWLVIEPPTAAERLIDELRAHKTEIRALLEQRSTIHSHFADWLAERCMARAEKDDSAGIGCMHVDFARWTSERGLLPPQSRRAFERLLLDSGFPSAFNSATALSGTVSTVQIPGSGAATLLIVNLGAGSAVVLMATSSALAEDVTLSNGTAILPGGSLALTIGSNTYLGLLGVGTNAQLNLSVGT